MYEAIVLEVLVGSPSGTDTQRQTIRHAVIRWNSTESRHFGVVLLPVMWETDAYSDLSQPAQSSINKQIVDDADIMIATFWTNLGSPTAQARSGTIEEIDRFLAAGKHVFLYFCDMDAVSLDQDTTEVDALKAFREEMKKKGLFSSYRTLDELSEMVRDNLTRLIHDMGQDGQLGKSSGGGPPSTPPETPGSDVRKVLAQLHAELRGYSAKWETMMAGLDGDFSVDRRHALASEVERVTLEVVRMASTVAPRAPFVTELSKVAGDAATLARTRVYLDGGRSFNALTEGCGQLLTAISAILALKWAPSEEGTPDVPAADGEGD